MKKIIYSVLMMFMVAMTFTSCADVPMPYDDPNQAAIDEEGSAVEPAGLGTIDDPYNVAAANALIESGEAPGTNVYVKGKIVSIREIDTASFGNASFYISDDGNSKNQLLVYRSMSLGKKPFKSEDEIKDGDEVIICGVLVNYNGTYEFTQGCYIYSLNGETSGGGGATGEAKGSGTLDDPYNPAGAAAAVKDLTWTDKDNYETTGNVYVKGKISRIAEKGTFTEGGSYGNASFYISDDGTENGEFYCFRILYLGNKKFEAGKTDIKVGDEVIICGQLMNYRGNTPETDAGKAYLYSLNGETDGGGSQGGGESDGTATGSGTLADPYNSVAINNIAKALGSNEKSADYYFKGKVVSIAVDRNGVSQNYNAGYGNASFYISDDGTEKGQFYVYRALYFENKDYTSGDILKVGDEVVLYGKVTNYNGKTPESAQKEAYLYSLNGKTSSSGGSGGGEGGGTSTSTVSKATDGATLTFTDSGLTASSSKVTVTFSEQGFTDQQEVKSLTLSDGTTITFSAEDSQTSPKYFNSGEALRLYARNSMTITGKDKGIAKVVLTCQSYSGTNYVGNEDASATSSDKSMKITNTWGKGSGGTQMRIQKMEITYAQ